VALSFLGAHTGEGDCPMSRNKRRKFYKPHTKETRVKIAAGQAAYQARVRAALAKSEAQS